LGGSLQRERALEIMKDSHVGAFGAIAVTMALLVKVAMVAQLAAMDDGLMVAGLFLAHVVSRTWPLLLIHLLPHVGDLAGSKSKPLADQITTTALLVAWLWCLAALGLVVAVQESGQWLVAAELTVHFEAALLCALGASALGFVWMGRWFAERLQGFTGDCLGATQQICELSFYLGFLLGWGALA
jgi:adenosylcobinamide-GDP ribazoletransferase